MDGLVAVTRGMVLLIYYRDFIFLSHLESLKVSWALYKISESKKKQERETHKHTERENMSLYLRYLESSPTVSKH